MDTRKIGQLAEHLDKALLNRQEVERLTLQHTELTLQDAYLIQDAGIAFRESRGEKVVGYKMGLTSEAKRKQMDLNSPIYGVLTDRMGRSPGSQIDLSELIHPKIEPEIAYIIGHDVRGRITFQEALEVCTGVCAALEILDSRFLNFKYFSLPDVVADNCSSSLFVLSDRIMNPKEVDVGDLEMKIEVNGVTAERGRSSAISGHPLQSVVQLCEMLHSRNLELKAGSIVLTGAATVAIQLEKDKKISLTAEQLGTVSVSC